MSSSTTKVPHGAGILINITATTIERHMGLYMKPKKETWEQYTIALGTFENGALSEGRPHL